MKIVRLFKPVNPSKRYPRKKSPYRTVTINTGEQTVTKERVLSIINQMNMALENATIRLA